MLVCLYSLPLSCLRHRKRLNSITICFMLCVNCQEHLKIEAVGQRFFCVIQIRKHKIQLPTK